ncbi:MAG: hypothetical protein BGO98_50060 [Myxococcales bacterium 68-20]|nr:hypothetical protein [Myxococcales bacterium]OJY29953.1 MAG: hypothetical protein BGO98_50060 [Myxococcales bacterium 68-20]
MERWSPLWTGFLEAVALVTLAGEACTKPQPRADAEPGASATTRAAEVVAPPAPPRSSPIGTVAVPDDRDVLVVTGETRRPIVYLHGMCGEARSDLEAWSASVREHGTVIALEGDAACPRGSGRSWSVSPDALDTRIDSAIEAVSSARAIELDPREVIVIGESMGASRALGLASRFPAKYTRLVLVGGPETPSAKDLRGVKAAALLAGEHESQAKMRQGTARLESAGVDARFWELAGATHGTYGSDGARTMGEAVAFVAQR